MQKSTTILILTLGIFGIFLGLASAAEKIQLYPEEQIFYEDCMDTCIDKKCPDGFYKIRVPENTSPTFSCELACRKYLDCVDIVEHLMPMMKQRMSDRSEVYDARMDNRDFTTLCNKHCDKVTGAKPSIDEVGVNSVQMSKEECYIRCKTATYM